MDHYKDAIANQDTEDKVQPARFLNDTPMDGKCPCRLGNLLASSGGVIPNPCLVQCRWVKCTSRRSPEAWRMGLRTKAWWHFWFSSPPLAILNSWAGRMLGPEDFKRYSPTSTFGNRVRLSSSGCLYDLPTLNSLVVIIPKRLHSWSHSDEHKRRKDV